MVDPEGRAQTIIRRHGVFLSKKIFNFFYLKKYKNNKNYLYNNCFPVYNLSKKSYVKFKKIFIAYFFNKHVRLIQYHLIASLEIYLQKNILIKILNNNIYKKKKYSKRFKFFRLYKIYKKNKFSVLNRKNKFNLFEILEIILYSLYNKDLYMLKNWLVRNFLKLHYKNHNPFLFLFKVLVTDIFESYRNIFHVEGFYFMLKGKVGVTSNAKKKRVFFKIGPSNKNKKYKKSDFQQGVLKVSSGSLGLTMILTY